MMAGDWLKLHRRAIESQVFSDPHLWHLFCWCLMRANWKEGFFQGVKIPPGSFATGRDAAAESLGVSASALYRRLKKLEELKVIQLKANNRFTVISVVKWSFFQNCEQQENNQRTTSDTTSEQPADTIEEVLEVKKERITHTHSQRSNQKLEIPPELAVPFSRWAEWVFSTTGKPIPNIQAETLLMDLGRRGADKAARDVEFSIAKGARSILDSDNDFQKRNGTPATSTKQRVELQ